MYNRVWPLLFILAILLSSCNNSSSITPEAPETQGRLLVWHHFEGHEAEAFNDVLDEYTAIHGTIIIREYFPPDEMVGGFAYRSESGLGPDLLVNHPPFIGPLIRTGFIQELKDFNVDTSNFLPDSLDPLRKQGELYGMPFSLFIQVLCYNKEQVKTPPATLDDLLKDAEEGHRVALFSKFHSIFWGVSYFGGRLLDEKGKVILDQGGLAEWFEELKGAKNIPTFILQDDEEILHETFVKGEATYYVCRSNTIPEIMDDLGEDTLGVMPLPKYQGRSAAPILGVNALLINRLSSSKNKKLALQLAKFLTNPQQQTKLVLATKSQIPVNKKVVIDDNLSPIIAALIEQSETGIATPLEYQEQSFETFRYGQLYYTQVLAGEIEPEEAAREITQHVNDKFGLE
ncbi:extracellular solute-binding protein [Anaerolineales bacterium HSG6]|nr:extracellular solute-binding protein [Anaerolineales bacterium HSG6]MDM8531640.1 extracellular solute-binding protein [Anaerolineales bacterium HSG25]